MCHNSSNSSSEIGNTIQISPAKWWCFTWNNFAEGSVSVLKNLDSSIVPLLVFQREVGESGTPHLQGCLMLKSKGRPMSLGLCKSIHWEKKSNRSTKEQAIGYCLKPGGDMQYVRGWEVPRKDRELKLIDPVRVWEREILAYLKCVPDDRTIHWYWGPCNTGKTSMCKYLVKNHGALILSGKSSDMKNAIVTYKQQKKCHPDLIVLNVPKTFNSEYLSYEGIEGCKDMCFYSGKYEGGMICGPCPHFFVFSNEPPDLCKCDPNRWVVHRLSAA